MSDESKKTSDPITIVSGLPRSGTSMMMRILEAAGLSILTDGQRLADGDNPNGNYELEQVKGLTEGKADWLGEAEGKVIKVVSPLLPYLPEEEDRSYRVVVMRRNMEEILASQRRMLLNRGEPVRDMDDALLADLYEKNLDDVEAWAARSDNVEAVFVDYNELISAPEPSLEQVRSLVGSNADAQEMAAIIDPALYRNRTER